MPKTWISGLAYNGERSLADKYNSWPNFRKERALEQATTLYGLFPPCHDDSVGEWLLNAVKLGLITSDERIAMFAYRWEIRWQFPELRNE